MFNAACKSAIILSLAAIVAGCSKSSSSQLTDAESLLEQATNEYAAGNSRQALVLLDSLDTNYKNDSQTMRASLKLRPQIIEAVTLLDIADNDSLLADYAARIDSIKTKIKKVSLPGIEGYEIATSAYDAAFADKTGISARVSPEGQFYLVSSVNPAAGLNHWSVSAIIDGSTVTTDTVPYDGALNYHYGNSELITFSNAQCDTVGQFIAEHRTKSITIRFNGKGGKHQTVKLSAKQAEAIATAYHYAMQINEMRAATVNQMRLQDRLKLSREKAQQPTK